MGEAFDLFELLQRGFLDGFETPKVLKEPLFFDGADAGDVVETACEEPFGAPFSMKSDRASVRFISDFL